MPSIFVLKKKPGLLHSWKSRTCMRFAVRTLNMIMLSIQSARRCSTCSPGTNADSCPIYLSRQRHKHRQHTAYTINVRTLATHTIIHLCAIVQTRSLHIQYTYNNNTQLHTRCAPHATKDVNGQGDGNRGKGGETPPRRASQPPGHHRLHRAIGTGLARDYSARRDRACVALRGLYKKRSRPRFATLELDTEE